MDQIRGFNPRPREGATLMAELDAGLSPVSIHAPVKGRRRILQGCFYVFMFQSTPP